MVDLLSPMFGNADDIARAFTLRYIDKEAVPCLLWKETQTDDLAG